jgi:hypothetical protein
MNQNISNDVVVKWLLRIIGGAELFAIPFLLFPFSWMNEVHERLLGLGPLLHAPIVEYMARSLTALYAIHGALVFRLSFDVPRFRPVIQFLGGLHVTLGLLVLAGDIAAGLPWWWIVGEGPGIAAAGLAVLVFAQQPKSDEPVGPI